MIIPIGEFEFHRYLLDKITDSDSFWRKYSGTLYLLFIDPDNEILVV